MGCVLIDPRGRCNRKGLLIIASLMLVIQIGLASAFWGFGVSLTGVAATLFKLLFCWLALAACSKRLHDLDRSAWTLAWVLPATIVWTLVVALGFAFGLGIETLMPRSPWYPVAMGASMAPMFAAALWLHLAKGTAGANRFGPEPDGAGFSAAAPLPLRSGPSAAATLGTDRAPA